MPVDLEALPGRLARPAAPAIGRWCLVGLPGALICSGLLLWLWPQDSWRMSPWFWGCSVVLPLLAALLLGALALLAHERRREWIESWNQQQARQLQALLAKGQRRAALLDTAYCTAVGSSDLAQMPTDSGKPLKSTYFPATGQTVAVNRLEPAALDHSESEYCQRLTVHLRHIIETLQPSLGAPLGAAPVHVRIRHDGTLGDDQVAALWHEVAGAAGFGAATFTQQPGLLWLDSWLDGEPSAARLLSLEINLFTAPVANQAESVTAILLARAGWVSDHARVPKAWLHRPVSVDSQGRGVGEALRWANLEGATAEFFTLSSQVGPVFRRELVLGLNGLGNAIDLSRWQDLDDCFGMPAAALGNIALIIASERAGRDTEPQLLLVQDGACQGGHLQDGSLQACVVRPA